MSVIHLLNSITPIAPAFNGISNSDFSYINGITNFWPSFTGDNFTGDNGDAPNTDLWTENMLVGSVVSADIQGNKLNFAPPVDATNNVPNYDSKFILVGDFDIQIDFDFTCTPNDADYSYPASLRVKQTSDDSIVAHLSRIKGTTLDGYQAGGKDAGGATFAQSDASGKLRITRTSGAVRVYIWDGSVWEWDSSSYRQVANSNTEELYVTLYFEKSPNDTLTSNIDNFVINSGTIVIQ